MEGKEEFFEKISYFGCHQMGRIGNPKLWAISICFMQN